ncbi:hypothetical protein I4F81_006084 [Pyropia yezoensis]|uniref:Uncharacterized protein n=1 Tax=Pyropia yezoensis TaxID=2788 RepID=A0ACC3C0P8_PYRYE|nr:hypothetical protein I4F81_006084 [Neopyropia yezoensis]
MGKIKTALQKRFQMKDLGEAKVMLGMEIYRDKELGNLKLCQGKYATQVVEKYGMAECHRTATPMEVGLQLVKADKCDDAAPYREAVGSLKYLMVGTRPDLAFAVGKLSRFVTSHAKEHWAAVKRVLRYVKGSVDKGLVFSKSSSMTLKGYCDADWAGDHATRRSNDWRMAEGTLLLDKTLIAKMTKTRGRNVDKNGPSTDTWLTRGRIRSKALGSSQCCLFWRFQATRIFKIGCHVGV